MATSGDASHGTVRIAWPTLVSIIGARFTVRRLRVAVDAGGIRVIDLIDVAIGTNRIVVRQAPEGGVVKGGTQPAGSVMATGGCASRWEAGRNVIGNCAAQRGGALPSGDVAAIAVHRQITGVVAVDVAGRARGLGGIGMSTSQRKAGSAVIEFSVRPLGDGMAGSALRRGNREASRNVIGNISADGHRAVERGGMAAVTIR